MSRFVWGGSLYGNLEEEPEPERHVEPVQPQQLQTYRCPLPGCEYNAVAPMEILKLLVQAHCNEKHRSRPQPPQMTQQLPPPIPRPQPQPQRRIGQQPQTPTKEAVINLVRNEHGEYE